MRKTNIYSFTNSGKGKKNEDYCLYREISENTWVIILADGMGGLSNGDLAAKIVANTIFNTISTKIKVEYPEQVLQDAFSDADRAICKKSYELKCKMGAATTVVLLKGNKIYYCWQGNVRLYKNEKGKLIQLTKDHITNLYEHKFLTRCINGKGFRDNLPLNSFNLQNEETLILATDGYYLSIKNGNLKSNANNKDFELCTDDDCSFIEINSVLI